MDSLSRQNRTFYILLGAILFVHAVLMISKISKDFGKTSFAPSEKVIKLKIIQEAMKDLAMSDKKQIVQSEDTDSSEKTKEAFLSDKDRNFDRQSVARNVDTFKKAALGNSTVTREAQKKESQKTTKPNLKDIKLADIGFNAGEVQPKKIDRSPASEAVKGMKNGDELSQGLSATNDYVEEVALGDFTHLNTVEYKFYGFFHRIRQKLEQFWGNSIQEKANAIFRSGRRLPASENLVTSLQVTLNANGEIVAVKIIGASGVKELDDAAIESFNKAGPFPNPPKELLVNGKATIDWGFVVKS